MVNNKGVYTHNKAIDKIVRTIYNCDFRDALPIIDALIDEGEAGKLRLVRAYLRSLVNDIRGAYDDLNHLQLKDDTVLTLEASLLSKEGLMDLAKERIKLIPDRKKWLGIAGRRCDIEAVAGFNSVEGSRFPPEDLVPCLSEHLFSLAEWKAFQELYKSGLKNGLGEYGPLYIEFSEVGALHHINRLPGISTAIEGVRGWFSEDEAEFLAYLASIVGHKQDIVEIGSFCGRSTISLSLGTKSGNLSPIHSIDPHNGLKGLHVEGTYPEFVYNLEKRELLDFVTAHRTTSTKFAASWKGQNIGLLFIDADHEYESVKADFTAWTGHLADRAFVAFHDFPQAGPNKLLREILVKRLDMHPYAFLDSLFVFQFHKTEPDLNIERRDAYRQFLEISGRNYSNWIVSNENELLKKTIGILQDLKLSDGGESSAQK